MNFFDAIKENSAFFILGILAFCLLIFILSIIALIKASGTKKRVNKFMGTNEGSNFESMLKSFIEQSNAIDERQNRIINDIKFLQNQVRFCVQKIGIIRYNPFEDVGGDLCYAIAVLDDENDGFVLNSVYSRDGCYTYAKPIERGVCNKYKLSIEEEEAVRKAISSDKKRM